jgi:hypothetical protein
MGEFGLAVNEKAAAEDKNPTSHLDWWGYAATCWQL